MSSVKILVCCHKDTPRIKDSVFTPILLGSAYAQTELTDKFKEDFWDSTGDNIGDLHPYCAELSAIYWAWKNYSIINSPEYIGLFHYRRFLNFSVRMAEEDPWKCAFFNFDENTCQRYAWTQEQILNVCKDADLIIPDKERIMDPYDWVTPTNLETHYKHAHYSEDFDTAMSAVIHLYPEYKYAVERACNSNWGYFCNMFIMRKELFFEYAQWLFNILFYLRDKLALESSKYKGKNEHQKRVLGFLGERLFNVWIEFQQTQKHISTLQLQRLIGYLQDSEKNTFIKNYGRTTYNYLQNLKSEETDLEQGDTFNNRPLAPDVSIIVPVYNVDTYLSSCLDSLVNQTLKNIEIICIENGSNDKSYEILKTYGQKDSRILIKRLKKNVGMPTARNIGMDIMRGKYFAFVDSDDICDLTMFQKLYSKAELLHAEIVTCSVWAFINTIENGYIHRPLEWYGDTEFALPLSKRPQQLMEPAGWCKLFRTGYIRSLDYFEFRPGVLSYEDVPCITNAFIQAKRIGTVAETLYFYRVRNNGNLTASMNRIHIDDFISGDCKQQQIIQNHHYTDATVLSYVTEFRYLMVEYILSKIKVKDIPYLFKKVSALIQPNDYDQLERIFKFYPRRKFIYTLIAKKKAYTYITLRTAIRLLKRSKVCIKRVFHISREGIYKTFGLGHFYVKWIKKSYVEQTIKWYESKVKELDNLIFQYKSAYTSTANQVEQLRCENIDLLEKVSKTKNEYDDLSDKYDNTLKEAKQLRSEHNSALEKARILKDEYDNLSDKHTNLIKETENLRSEHNVTLGELKSISDSFGNLEQQYQSVANLLDIKNKETYGFYRAVWNTGWINVWKTYYNDNFTTITSEIDILKSGLDKESQKLIDLICYRIFKLLPLQENSELFLYDHLHIYTKEERDGAATLLNEHEIRQRYNIPTEEYLEIPVFRFQCGMTYFPPEVSTTLNGKDVIDGGAYWGDSALVLNDYGPRSIHAFEPYPDSYNKLRNTIQKNEMENIVIPVACGLGECTEIRTLYTQGMESGSNFSGVMPIATDERMVENQVDVVTIDDYARNNNLKIGLIKLDIEGNELAAIQGALDVIRRDRPLLAISIYHQPRDFFKIKPLLENLNLGYRFLIRKLSYHDLVSEVMLIAYVENDIGGK